MAKSRSKMSPRARKAKMERIPCSFCGEEFFEGYYLKRHVRSVHTKKKRFRCEICGWKTDERYRLRTHQGKTRCKSRAEKQRKLRKSKNEPRGHDTNFRIEEEVGEEMEVVDAKEAEGGNDKGSDSSEDSDEDEEYEVESILQSRFVKKKKQYLVKWVNYSDEWNTWEPMENLEGSQDLVAAFEKKEAEKLKKEESEKAAALERRKQAKAEREAKRREREAEKEAKRAERAKKEAEKPKKEIKIKTEGKKKSRAIISSSKSEKIDVPLVPEKPPVPVNDVNALNEIPPEEQIKLCQPLKVLVDRLPNDSEKATDIINRSACLSPKRKHSLDHQGPPSKQSKKETNALDDVAINKAAEMPTKKELEAPKIDACPIMAEPVSTLTPPQAADEPKRGSLVEGLLNGSPKKVDLTTRQAVKDVETKT